MKSFVICEKKETLLIMRLAGIGGVQVKDDEQLKYRIDEALNDDKIGIIMISENLYKGHSTYIMEKKLLENEKLIIQIPEPEGLQDKDYIMNHIRNSIGIKL